MIYLISGYDNWLVVTGVQQDMMVVDTSQTILAVHQTGDDGNYAGFLHQREIKPGQDPLNNIDLAGHSFSYRLGRVTCAQYETRPFYGRVTFHRRPINYCNLWLAVKVITIVFAICLLIWFCMTGYMEPVRKRVSHSIGIIWRSELNFTGKLQGKH